MSDTIVVSIANRVFEVIDAEKAFGPDFPAEYREALTLGTADDIVTLMMLSEMEPIIMPNDVSTRYLIEERRRGLALLVGAEKVQAEINAAIERIQKQSAEEIARRTLPFMM